MARQRDKIQMSEDEIRDFLEGCKSLNVATLDKQGAPHLTTLWFALSEGKFIFETYGASQKVVNLWRDARIAVLCEQGTSYEQLRGVSVKGRAQIVEEGAQLEALMHLLTARNHPGLSDSQLAQITAQMIRKRVVIVVHPDKVMSWDHRKLAPVTM